MSAICGLVNLDGAPADPDVLRKMGDASAFRGPDGIRYWVQGEAGLVHLALNTTPESLREKQPLVGADGSLCLAADARVDNRAELARALGASGHLTAKEPTDADLILAAYSRWGEECPKRIIGDFAFAIWDAGKRRLFCVRDPIGMRLLHYCQRGQTLIFASTVGAILAALGGSPPPNKAFIEALLDCNYDRWVHETAWQGISRLPPSHCLTASSARVLLSRYWTFGAQGDVRFKSDADYEARFRELFEEAVRARLRSVGPVGILVSGGLDSSSVACVADRLIASECPATPGRIYSCVFDRTPGADEKGYGKAVAEKCRHLKTTLIPADDCWALREFAGDEGYPLDEPEIGVSRSLLLKPLRAAYGDGCRVILGGNGGDQVLGGEPYHTPAILRDVGLGRLLSEIRHFRRYSRCSVARLLTQAYLAPLIPKRLCKWMARRGRDETRPFRTPAAPAPLNFLPPPRLNSQSSMISYAQLTQGLYSARMVSLDTLAGYAGIEWRFPFLDRRLIDFMFAVPPRLRFRDGLIKYVLRRAMAGILPDAVRRRTDFAHFTELEMRGLREKERGRILELLKDARLVRAGYADAGRLLSAWDSFWQDSGTSGPNCHLVAGLCVEAWLRKNAGDRKYLT